MKVKANNLTKEYIIVNMQGEAYTGMLNGYLNWSHNWDEAKYLYKENTSRVLESTYGTELIEL